MTLSNSETTKNHIIVISSEAPFAKNNLKYRRKWLIQKRRENNAQELQQAKIKCNCFKTFLTIMKLQK